MSSLTPRQQAFVNEYLVDLNARQAALRAGYSQRSALTQKMFHHPAVRAAIQQALAARGQRLQATREQVLRALADIAFCDPRRVLRWGPDGVELLPCKTLTDADASAVAEVSETPGREGKALRLKLHDRLKALELLGRHLGLFNDKLAIKAEVAVTREQLDAAARAALLAAAAHSSATLDAGGDE